jgi:hypothetical protein
LRGRDDADSPLLQRLVRDSRTGLFTDRVPSRRTRRVLHKASRRLHSGSSALISEPGVSLAGAGRGRPRRVRPSLSPPRAIRPPVRATGAAVVDVFFPGGFRLVHPPTRRRGHGVRLSRSSETDAPRGGQWQGPHSATPCHLTVASAASEGRLDSSARGPVSPPRRCRCSVVTACRFLQWASDQRTAAANKLYRCRSKAQCHARRSRSIQYCSSQQSLLCF